MNSQKKTRAQRSSVSLRSPANMATYATRTLLALRAQADPDGKLLKNCQGDFMRATFPELSEQQGYAVLKLLSTMGLRTRQVARVRNGKPSAYTYFIDRSIEVVTADMVKTARNGISESSEPVVEISETKSFLAYLRDKYVARLTRIQADITELRQEELAVQMVLDGLDAAEKLEG